MVSNIANPFCAEVVKGIEEEAEKNGYRILLCNSGSDIERSRSGLSLLSGKIVDGIITMDAFSKLPELAALIGSAPWVQCAEYADAGTVSCVGINDVDASQHAISQLADGGRKRIAMINHDLSYKYARLRERGYKSVLHLRDLDYQAVEYARDLSSSAGMAAMQNLLKDNPPDAVFAVSDTLAAGALRAIQQAGLRVPEDIAVVGFDGTELAEMISLTTIEQPSRDIGRKAVDLLLNKIDNPDAPTEGDAGLALYFPRQYLIIVRCRPPERISFPVGTDEYADQIHPPRQKYGRRYQPESLHIPPNHRVGEGIYFNRQTICVRRQLAHHQRHIFTNTRVVTQIFIQIGAEGADIGHLAQV